jgi:hypothetical protein
MNCVADRYDGTVGTLQITKGASVQIVFGVPGFPGSSATVTLADQLQDNGARLPDVDKQDTSHMTHLIVTIFCLRAGIVHLIDNVLVPPAAVSTTAVNAGVFTGLVSALTKGDKHTFLCHPPSRPPLPF